MKSKKSLIAIMLVVVFGVVGTTIAYYSSQDTFTNEFDAGKYKIKTEEVFESPDNWIPGDTTPKEISVTNQGNVDAAVKVCFREKWEDENGNPLPLFNNIGRQIVFLTYKHGFKNYWYKDCASNTNCYYYYKKLAPGETTEGLLESVTFNEFAEFETTNTCTTDPVTHKTTCVNSVNGYSGGKYTLYADIETVQYNQYENQFGTIVAEQNGACSNLNIMRSIPTRFLVFYEVSQYRYIKASELDNYIIDTNSCDVEYINTVSEDNKYYTNCKNAYYIDDSYDPNYVVAVRNIPITKVSCNRKYYQGEDRICVLNTISNTTSSNGWQYVKGDYSLESDINMFINLPEESINNWNNNDYTAIQIFTNRDTFKMPGHHVLINQGIN